jgi:hypothetical protein
MTASLQRTGNSAACHLWRDDHLVCSIRLQLGGFTLRCAKQRGTVDVSAACIVTAYLARQQLCHGCFFYQYSILHLGSMIAVLQHAGNSAATELALWRDDVWWLESRLQLS